MNTLFTDQNDHQIDPNKNYYEELVGEGKKFRTQEDLAKKSLYADAHIARLEKENSTKDEAYAKLSAEYNAAASLQEMIKALSQKEQTLDNHAQPEVNNDVQSPAIKPEDIEKMIGERLRQ